MKRAAFFATALCTAACAATPPPHWARGGATLDIPRARWVYDGVPVDVMPDGKILVDGEHEITLDRGGRVFDLENAPIALLEPNGRLVGPDSRALGVVGVVSAALPDERTAWLSIGRSGEVVRYDDEGDRTSYGAWVGCDGSPRAHQVCTLVTHLFALRARGMQRGAGSPPMYFGGVTGVSIGIGVGAGVGVH